MIEFEKSDYEGIEVGGCVRCSLSLLLNISEYELRWIPDWVCQNDLERLAKHFNLNLYQGKFNYNVTYDKLFMVIYISDADNNQSHCCIVNDGALLNRCGVEIVAILDKK